MAAVKTLIHTQADTLTTQADKHTDTLADTHTHTHTRTHARTHTHTHTHIPAGRPKHGHTLIHGLTSGQTDRWTRKFDDVDVDSPSSFTPSEGDDAALGSSGGELDVKKAAEGSTHSNRQTTAIVSGANGVVEGILDVVSNTIPSGWEAGFWPACTTHSGPSAAYGIFSWGPWTVEAWYG